MARYIDADKIITDAIKEKKFVFQKEDLIKSEEVAVRTVYKDLAEFIDSQPTADVVEVKHGKWEMPTINLARFADGYVICSECDVMLPIITELPEYYYCPNCGAKMDGPQKINHDSLCETETYRV